MKLVTSEQMRALEASAAEAGVPERALMEEAGLAAAQEAWMAVGAMEGRGILVLVGPGNNGGDGLVAARHLVEWGASVALYLLRPRSDDDEVWAAVAGLEEIVVAQVAEDPGFERLERWLDEASCVVDALLGTGASRAIEGDLAEVLTRLTAARGRSLAPQLIALDLPTGVHPDTGAADPLTVEADMTIAFGHPKVGTYTMPGARLAGRVVPVDIGIPSELSASLPFEDLDFRATQRRLPARAVDAHKGTFGTVVVAAGSRRYPGAARLASESAARSGVGLTRLAAPEAMQAALAAGVPDVIHEPLPSTDGHLDGDAARQLLRALDGADALLVGPGLGHTAATEEFVRTLLDGLAASGGVEGLRGVVLDADALNVLSGLDGWAGRLDVPHVLTPHPGEMARLRRTSTAAVQASRLDTALACARDTGSVVVLKGACTIVAAPDGRARISAAATSMLATGGTGDVLAGLIAGLIAQGLDAFDAASVAVWMHADAARLVTESHGTAAALASDLLPALVEVRRVLGGGSPRSRESGLGGLSGLGNLGGMGALGGLGGGMGGVEPGGAGWPPGL
ncbi:MAG: NAD(P)H-hydrate dehydratase [Dehalococcoidia bacterium]